MIKNKIKNAGSKIIPIFTPIRTTKESNKIITATKRRVDFTIIPIKIENITSPSLYSLFRGLKNVRRSKGTENRFAIKINK